VLFEAGHGIAPDLIYVRGAPAFLNMDQTTINKKLCTLIRIEVGFRRDLGCDKKHVEKTDKYSPLIMFLKKDGGRGEFVAVLIGHANTTLTRTLDHLAAAFSTIRSRVDQANASKGTPEPTGLPR
jgi:hypothetical protein